MNLDLIKHTGSGINQVLNAGGELEPETCYMTFC